jgi:peptidyl-prolyl cis-trans isomerase A (cyclophilin A)
MQGWRLSLLAIALGAAATSGWTTGCGKSRGATASASAANSSSPAEAGGVTGTTAAAAGAADSSTPKPTDPQIVLHTTAGDITLRLFAEKAPRTVENFLRGYAERGFYDQTIFHHVEPGRMLIGGGYTADLQRKPTRAPIYNESRNGISNRRGTVAMIRDPEAPHSATSEFFFNLTDNGDFDFQSTDGEDVPGYCVFGEVAAGMDVVERIAHQPTESRGEFSKVPSPTVTITSVERLP